MMIIVVVYCIIACVQVNSFVMCSDPFDHWPFFVFWSFPCFLCLRVWVFEAVNDKDRDSTNRP